MDWTEHAEAYRRQRIAADSEADTDLTEDDLARGLLHGIDTVGLHRDDVIERIGDALADVIQERDELRSLIAPLIDDPLEPVVGADWVGPMRCRFCGATMPVGGYLRHGAGCATHRTEQILGRTEG